MALIKTRIDTMLQDMVQKIKVRNKMYYFVLKEWLVKSISGMVKGQQTSLSLKTYKDNKYYLDVTWSILSLAD